jgi:hypothetical protein
VIAIAIAEADLVVDNGAAGTGEDNLLTNIEGCGRGVAGIGRNGDRGVPDLHIVVITSAESKHIIANPSGVRCCGRVTGRNVVGQTVGCEDKETLTFGNGNDDYVLSSTDVSISASNNTITFGNGIDVNVNLVGSSSNNTIKVGNGSNDLIQLGTGVTSNGGGDYIATGIGQGTLLLSALTLTPTRLLSRSVQASSPGLRQGWDFGGRAQPTLARWQRSLWGNDQAALQI